MHYLDGFPEVSRVRGVLEGVCSNQHHVQGYPAAPHVRNLSIIVFPRQHLYTTKHVSTDRTSAVWQIYVKSSCIHSSMFMEMSIMVGLLETSPRIMRASLATVTTLR